jgi:hypothetical protein
MPLSHVPELEDFVSGASLPTRCFPFGLSGTFVPIRKPKPLHCRRGAYEIRKRLCAFITLDSMRTRRRTELPVWHKAFVGCYERYRAKADVENDRPRIRKRG